MAEQLTLIITLSVSQSFINNNNNSEISIHRSVDKHWAIACGVMAKKATTMGDNLGESLADAMFVGCGLDGSGNEEEDPNVNARRIPNMDLQPEQVRQRQAEAAARRGG